MDTYGHKLDPHRSLREPRAVKAERQSMVITNNPSTVEYGNTLTVRFPQLGPDDVIIPGTAKLAFNLKLDSTDANRSIVNNIGRSIVSRLTVKLEGQSIFELDDPDVFYIYSDLWKTTKERKCLVYQGIQNENVAKLRMGAADAVVNKKDKAVAHAYKDRFCIPLDFELLVSHSPYCQSALGDKLVFEFGFQPNSKVILATGDADASYKLTNIALEYDIVTDPGLARHIKNQYTNKTAVYFDRIQRQEIKQLNKNQTMWNFTLNNIARSMKGLLFIFKEPQVAFQYKPEVFYNPNITQIDVTIEGKPNKVYAKGMLPHNHWDEARKYFAGGRLKDHTTDTVSKELYQHDIELEDYLTNKYALWIDLRTSEENRLHGSGKHISTAEGITLQIQKEADVDGEIKAYIYTVFDAQLNIEGGRLSSIVY
jgi:hypothetical protein